MNHQLREPWEEKLIPAKGILVGILGAISTLLTGAATGLLLANLRHWLR